jgi:tRNA threonylcarbamoyladenosine biosynthesis protein TsaB
MLLRTSNRIPRVYIEAAICGKAAGASPEVRLAIPWPSMSTSPRSCDRFSLAFETSTAVGRVALGDAEGRVLGTRVLAQPRAHAVGFLPAVAELCREHDIAPAAVGEVYVSIGPGSFTGLRIGITAARMLAFATGAKIVSVPTLDIVARNALDAEPRPERVVVILDAKRARVYTTAYALRDGKFVAQGPPVEAEPLAFLRDQPADTCVLGEGVAYHRAAIAESGRCVLDARLWPPRAETVLRLGSEGARQGRFVNPRELIPTYIRPPEAEEKWSQKHGAGSV